MTSLFDQVTEKPFDIVKMWKEPDFEFDCCLQEQNVYLLKHAWADQLNYLSVTHLLLINDRPVGYVTLILDELPTYQHERPEGARFGNIPAIKIAQMGVDKSISKQGYGQVLVSFAVNIAKQIRKSVGCRFVTADSLPAPDLIKWYENQGFQKNKLDQKLRKDQITGTDQEKEEKLAMLPVSMRLDVGCMPDDSEDEEE